MPVTERMMNTSSSRLLVSALLFGALSLAQPGLADEAKPPETLPKPTPEQVAWQDLEVGLFIHFDIPVFARPAYDWRRDEVLDPKLYYPTNLNTDQWMEAARGMGARYAVFVAKHWTGFISWQSDVYPYGVKQSSWREGKGDVVRESIASCRKAGIEPGLYCSVGANGYWRAVNTNSSKTDFARMVERMTAELWSGYGKLGYVWFDGGAPSPAKGGPDLVPILKRYQPQVVAFQGPENLPAGLTRWVGNEDGVANYPSWATVRKLNEEGSGHADGAFWQPGECDVLLRGDLWFWLLNTEHRIRSLDNLMDIYYKSVGRNCNLILNANIDRNGLVPEADMKRFKEFGAELKRRFGKSLAETHGKGVEVRLALKEPTLIDHVILMEQIAEGERIREYVVEGRVGGEWKKLCDGQSVGHKRIQQFAPIEVDDVRLRCPQSVAEPIICKLAVYFVGATRK